MKAVRSAQEATEAAERAQRAAAAASDGDVVAKARAELAAAKANLEMAKQEAGNSRGWELGWIFFFDDWGLERKDFEGVS